MNPELANSFLESFAVAKVSKLLAIKPCENFGPSMDLFDLLNPDLKGSLTGGGFVEFNFDFVHITLLYLLGYIIFK